MLFPVGLWAQRIDGLFVSRSDESGTLYHVLPITDLLRSDGGAVVFDLTRHSTWEHIVLHFSIAGESTALADSLVLVRAGGRYAVPVKRLFVEREKKAWLQRYEAFVATDAWCEWSAPLPDGDPELLLKFPMATARVVPVPGKWVKRTRPLALIMELMEADRTAP